MGLKVTSVDKNGGAEKAGIIPDDVIISYDGIDNLNDSDSLIEAVIQAKERQEDIAIVIKRNGKIEHLKAKPGKLGMKALPVSNSTHYFTGRSISSFSAVLGWIVVALSVLLLIFGIQESIELIVLSTIGILSGLFLVMAAQATRAVMDNADHTRLILEELKNNK